MTQLREQAIEMINEIPEDKIIYVLNILRNVKDLSIESKEEKLLSKKQSALQVLQKYKGRLPADFEYKKELEKAREERYEDFS